MSNKLGGKLLGPCIKIGVVRLVGNKLKRWLDRLQLQKVNQCINSVSIVERIVFVMDGQHGIVVRIQHGDGIVVPLDIAKPFRKTGQVPRVRGQDKLIPNVVKHSREGIDIAAPFPKASFITGVNIVVIVVVEMHPSDQIVVWVSNQVDCLGWQLVIGVRHRFAICLMCKDRHAGLLEFDRLIPWVTHDRHSSAMRLCHEESRPIQRIGRNVWRFVRLSHK